MGALRTLVGAALLVGGAAAVIGWIISAPVRLDDATLAQAPQGDAARGKRIFAAAGCSSCHARPKSEGDARLQLAGGLELNTPFGTFVPPNISSDPEDGIGAWTFADFANAMMRGVSPGGQHYYPAFPYTSYARMQVADVSDLYAFMKTLPAVDGKAAGHKLGFPFNIRRGLGLWKLVNLSSDPVIAFPEGTPGPVLAGRYLVEGPGHCGECHTPRDFGGGLKKAQWLAGAAAASGTGSVPNITSGDGGIGDWSEGDIVTMLESGFTPEFDSVGREMADVVKNTAELTAEDRAAIAAYLKAVPAHANAYRSSSAPAN